MTNQITIIIPVYNEGANFDRLWKDLSSKIRSDFTVFVVYDFDEDDTLPVVKRIIHQNETRIRLIKNQVRKGVVGAITTGFNQVEHGPILVVMADLRSEEHTSELQSHLNLVCR